MPVNYEVKSQLAKLLATEDLIVENKNVSTAQFNVETRVLTLPMWKRASSTVYDLLVGHEVGHALFTPDDWGWEKVVPHQFVNVTEDARIEKLMKRKYPGLHKTFYSGYSELSDQDFFCIEDQDVDEMNLADRANLFFKIGRFIDISFTEEEMVIIKQIGDAETFDEAVEAAKTLYAYCKGNQEPQKQPMHQPPQSGGQGGGEQQEQQQFPENTPVSSGDSEDESPEAQQNESKSENQNQDETPDGAPGTEPEVQTDQTFEDRVQEFNSNLDGRENGYYEMPKFDAKKFIIPFAKIQKDLQESEKINLEGIKELGGGKDIFGFVDSEYQKFRKSAQKEVNYLVKEFECKKAADAYARSSTARTGVLDCSKLHTFKYNEDLFKKVTTVTDGKNHGLIFILDWSGSMGNCILETIKQLYNLIWFCNKCNIPFDVYAFTNSYIDSIDPNYRERTVWEENKFIISGEFSLMNLFSSTAKKKDLEAQMLSVFRMVFGMRMYVNYSYPAQYSLSGTPLNEALVMLHQVIPEFKKNNDLQKVHCFVLTDGEASGMMIGRENYYGGHGAQHISGGSSYLRNRKTGFTYLFEYQYHSFTEVILQDLKDTFPNTNFIGIRLCPPREMNNFIRNYQSLNEDTLKKIKKDKYFDIKNSGYTSYFAMQTGALNQDADFNVEEGASKAKIKSAFIKNLKTKSLNKKVLGKFMELVA